MGQKELKSVLFVFLLILSMVAMASFASADVLINEFLADSNFTGAEDKLGEWIELYNNGSSQVDLDTWVVEVSSGENFTITDLIIPQQSYVILAHDYPFFNYSNPAVNLSGIRIFQYGSINSNFILTNTDEFIVLFSNSGNVADNVSYGGSNPQISAGRFPNATSNIINLSVNTPGAANDNLPPSLNRWLNGLTNNSNVKGTVNVTVNITDLVYDVSSAFIRFNGSTFLNFSMDNINGDLWNFTWNTQQLNFRDGMYNLTVWFNDTVGLSINSTLYNVTVDNTAPVIFSINSPANNSIKSGVFVINVTADDVTTELTSLFYNITNGSNNVILTAEQGNGTNYWNASINSTSLGDGSHNITIYAVDTVGNLNNKTFLNVTTDNSAPDVSFISPINNSNLSGIKTLNITVSDATTSISNVSATLMNGSGTVFNFTLQQIGSNYSSAFNTTQFPDGQYMISVFANDTVGNKIQFNQTTNIDNTVPLASNETPANHTFVNIVSNINVSLTINDTTSKVNASSISFTINSVQLSPTSIGQSTNAVNPSFLLVGPYSNGQNFSISVNSKDNAGNSMPTYSWSFAIDTMVPVINSISTNDSDSKVRNSTPLNISVNVANSLASIFAVNISNTNTIAMSQLNSSLWAVTTNASNLGCVSNGNCTITVKAYDAAGNVNNSETLILVVDNSAPNASIIVNDADLKVRSTDSLLFNATVNDTNFDSGSTVTIGNSSTVSLSKFLTSNQTTKWSATTTTSALGCPSNGECTVRLTATDIAGNMNNSKTVVLTVDSLAPNVTIAINSSTSVNNITVLRINVTAADTNTVSNVSINGTRLNNTGGNEWRTVNATYQLCPGVLDTTCVLRVTAIDEVSNSNSSETLTLTINSFAPVLATIPDITFNEDGHNATINLSNFVSDQDTLDENITWSASLVGNNLTVSINQTSKLMNVSTSANFNGARTFVLQANDSISTVNSNVITVTINPVNDIPTTPSLSSPANNSNVSTSSASLDWASSSDADSDTITYYVFFGNNSNPGLNATVQDSNLTIANITKGQTYFWKVISSDNTANSSNSSTFRFLATANTAPVLTGQVANVTWLEDIANSSINLSAKFTDSEGDTLTFSSTTPSNVAVSINQATGIVTLTPSANFVGTNNVTFTANDGTNSTSSNQVTLTVVNANDATSISSFSPSGNNSIAVSTGSQRFDVVFADIDAGDRPTSSWFRNGTSIAPSNSSNVTVSSLNAGIYNITVLITDNASATARYEWKLTATSAINSSGLTSPVLSMNESQRQAATNISINQTTFGGIDFGSNALNFSGVVNLEDAFNISNGIVSVNTNTYPGLNKSAYIVMKGLNFTKAPLIFSASGFESTSGGSLCSNTTCANITYDSTNKILRFNAAHFTTFFTQQNTTNGAPIITSSASTGATINEEYRYDVEASDPDNDAISFSLTTAPSGMSISSSSGLITFTPSSLGNFSVTVRVSDGNLTDSQSYNLTVGEGSRLRITDIDVKVGGSTDKNVDNNTRISKDAAPGDNVEFELEIGNFFTNAENLEIEDITVEITIEGIDDGDDLEEEADEFSLDADDEDKASVEFEVPLDVDEDTYDVVIEVEGQDENGTLHNARWELQLDVDKEKHEIRVIRASATPSDVACGRSVSINTEIINTGSEDEDDVKLEILNEALGISSITEAIELEEGTDDNRYSKLVTATISEDVEPGSYPVEVNAYYDGKLSGSETVNINVGQCERTVQVREPVREQPKTTVITPQPQVTPQAEQPIKVSASDDLYYTMLAIMIVIFIGTAIFVIGAGFMLLGRR